jgi:hypothetical protein
VTSEHPHTLADVPEPRQACRPASQSPRSARKQAPRDTTAAESGLRQVAAAIVREYAPDQVAIFLNEQGIPPDWLALAAGIDVGDAHAVLATVWRAGSMGRRLVRRFLGRWLDGQLITGPDGELRAAVVGQLARQGWQSCPADSVLIAAEPVRGIPVSAPFLREAPRPAALASPSSRADSCGSVPSTDVHHDGQMTVKRS